MITSKITTVFNKAGNRLLSKCEHLPISQTRKISEPNIPANAKSFDVVFIEKNFGKENLTIKKYRDNHGKMIKSVMEVFDKLDNKVVQKTETDYIRSANKIEINKKMFKDNQIAMEKRETLTSVKFLMKKLLTRTFFKKNYDLNNDLTSSTNHSFWGEFGGKSPKKLEVINKNNDENIKKSILYKG